MQALSSCTVRLLTLACTAAALLPATREADRLSSNGQQASRLLHYGADS
jgi:hypothetical protein